MNELYINMILEDALEKTSSLNEEDQYYFMLGLLDALEMHKEASIRKALGKAYRKATKKSVPKASKTPAKSKQVASRGKREPTAKEFVDKMDAEGRGLNVTGHKGMDLSAVGQRYVGRY